MIPVLAIPNIQMPPPILAESFVGVPTQTSALARIPFNAVPSTVSPESIYNNSRSMGTYGSPVAPTAPAGGFAHSLGLLVPGVQQTQNGFFASSFVAQILGQGAVSESSDLFSSFFAVRQSGSALTLDTEILERFSLTKYKPSDAFRPPLPPQGTAKLVKAETLPPQPAPVSTNAQPAAAAPAQTASVNVAVQSAPLAQTASAALPRSAEAAPARTSEERTAPRSSLRLNSSLIRPRGIDAYAATFTRNLLNLGSKPDEEPIRIQL